MFAFRRTQPFGGGERPATPYNTRSNTPEPPATRSSLPKVEEQIPFNVGETAAIQGMSAEARYFVVGKLIIYFVLSVVVTLLNKSILTIYPYPWTLTTFHCVATAVGTQVLGRFGNYLRIRQPSQVQIDSFTLMGVSFLYALNIAASNTALGFVSVTTHQTIRATIPLFTALINAGFYKRFCSGAVYLILVIIFFGATTATYDSFGVSPIGFCFTLFGAQLAAWKAIVMYRLQITGQHLQPFELIRAIAPIAALWSFFCAYMNGEVDHFVVQEIHGNHLTTAGTQMYLLNSALAFALTWSSFSANRAAGPLSIAVAGNVKQVATIAMALVIFQHGSDLIHWSGIAVTVVGSMYYTWLEHGPRDNYTPLYHEQRDLNIV